MTRNASKSLTHLMILRPYALSSEALLANDRYLNIAKASSSTGILVTLLAQNFSHSKLSARLPSELQIILDRYPFARFVSVPSYKRSTSLARLGAELIYALKAFTLLISLKPSHVLVGEPLFFTGWIALFYGFLFRKSISSDLIDAWPEALSIPKHHPLVFAAPFNIALFPLTASRALRLKLYQKLFTVSKSYIRLIPRSERSRAKVFYECSQSFEDKSISLPDERLPAKFGCRSPFIISYAGSLGSGYDISTIIDAAVILEKWFPGCFVFNIAGGGHKSIQLTSSRVENLFFYGYLSSTDVCKVLSTSHSMLLPYNPNSAVAMPKKFFDAVNFRLPVVSSLKLECHDLIKGHNLGTCYQPQKPESLAYSIISISEDYREYYRSMCAFASLHSHAFSTRETYKQFAIDLLR